MSAALARRVGRSVAPKPAGPVHGGDINTCVRWETERGPMFVKLAPAARIGTFEAEAEALEELADARALRVPAVLGCGVAGREAFLALEWIEFGRATEASEIALGEGLARLHAQQEARFGWRRDNTIGSTPQRNAWCDDWVDFYGRERLGFQLELAESQGLGGRTVALGRRLCERLSCFFETYRPVPSLLHGDLWGGNWAADDKGAPVIFDPATYYGDREADLAMTRLFGGFGRNFYRAYETAWPLDPGADVRRDLYNLYHVLNHFNLFGGGYGAQAGRMIERLLAETGG
jgi:fructosamine-3-kinase